MSLFKSYWTVEGISPDARDAAIRAADADGEDLGVWLSRLINKVGLAEHDAEIAAGDSVKDAEETSAEDTVEASSEDAVEDAEETAAETIAEAPAEEDEDEPDDKMSSIERAMLQSRAAADG